MAANETVQQATQKVTRRIHLEFCFETNPAFAVSMEDYISIIEAMLPGGSLVTVREHKGGYCVAGDSKVTP